MGGSFVHRDSAHRGVSRMQECMRGSSGIPTDHYASYNETTPRLVPREDGVKIKKIINLSLENSVKFWYN